MEGPIYVLWAWLILVFCFLYVYGLKSDYNYQIFFDQKFDIQFLYNLCSQHLNVMDGCCNCFVPLMPQVYLVL